LSQNYKFGFSINAQLSQFNITAHNFIHIVVNCDYTFQEDYNKYGYKWLLRDKEMTNTQLAFKPFHSSFYNQPFNNTFFYV